MELSIVAGTYNRISYLKRMVESVRRSVGVGLPYEIVIVDGGSTDGTRVWCESQSDIVFINQGKLLGAVKAFNDGAKAAKGRYVILANDDVEFIDRSIIYALVYMHQHPSVGIGCFYQNRDGLDWHVSSMSAITQDGKPVGVYYGQVCIVPKWLGDKVGWWGDYLYTYGGDNEISCNVLELGYKVEPVPCTCIYDLKADDALRKINNPEGKINPDSQAFINKWTRVINGKKTNGPVVALAPKVPSPLQKVKRIFYAPIYEPGMPIQKQTKHGLRDALAKTGLVLECDYLTEGKYETLDLLLAFQPDIAIFQLHDVNIIDHEWIREAKQELPDTKFVNWNGDYHPETILNNKYIEMMRQFDAAGFVTTDIYNDDRYKSVRRFYWQIGYEPSNAKPNSQTPMHDVVFMANGYAESRVRLVKDLRSAGIRLGLYGRWPKELHADGFTLYDFDAGARIYQNSKFALSDNMYPYTGFVSNRLFQVMAAGGSLLLQQHIAGMEELMGLVDGKHLIVWYNIVDLLEKITYYMQHESERVAIAKAGTQYILANHSFDIRVKELYAFIGC